MNPENSLFIGLAIPSGLIDWCEDRGIQGRLIERFDGGGTTGHIIEFSDPDTRNLVSTAFAHNERNHLAGEATRYLGRLW
jgi:hypothetical protein